MQDDQLLTQYARTGSDAAFSHLVARHLPLVYRTCRRELGSDALAEDAAQVVFLLLARKAKTLRVGPSLAGWLFRAAHFVAKDVRKQEARRLRREEAVMQESVHWQTTPLSDWDSVEPLLSNALASLKPADREAVLLRFFEGHTLAETGALLGLSEDAARMRCARTIEKLRRYLTFHGAAVTGLVLTGFLTTEAARPVPAHAAAMITQGALQAISTGPTANVLLLSKGVLKAMWIKTASSLAFATAAIFAVSLTATSLAKGNLRPKITQVSKKTSHKGTAPDDALSPLDATLAKREQRLSHLTFGWQIKDQKTSLVKPSDQQHSYTSTQTWQIARAGDETLVTGTRQQGTYSGDFVQYYQGQAGIIVNTRSDFSGQSVMAMPPVVWGSTGDSIRYCEPFQTGFNLMPEHLVLLTGLNPLALYNAQWQVKEAIALTWVLEASAPQGSHPYPSTTETIHLTLSRRLGGAPAKIVVTQGNAVWTYQALGYQRRGADWICDKFSLDLEDPNIQKRTQIWTLQAVKSTLPLPPLPIPQDTRQMVTDYRLVGLNLTTEEYLDSINQQPSKAVMYAWPGRFPAINELPAIRYH